MGERTTTFTKRIGDHHFEIVRVSFSGVREKAGFQRLVQTARHLYYINATLIPKDVWMALRAVAKESHVSA